jgi:phosphatidylserine decarboxylase
MRLHREGTNTILICTFVVCISLFLLLKYEPVPTAILYTMAAALIVLWLIVVAFFRVPVRKTFNKPGTVKSPCDGKVVVIEKVFEPEYFNEERLQVSIFMSPLNVHINYFPISGITKYVKYHPGKYLVAWHPKSSTENERSTVVVADENGVQVLMRQIAGALARRICTYPKEGDSAEQGNEFGFIKFGSRVDLLLPIDCEVQVKLNEKVVGSQTIIAAIDGKV